MRKVLFTKRLSAKLLIDIIISFLLSCIAVWVFSDYIIVAYITNFRESISTNIYNLLVIGVLIIGIIIFIISFLLMTNGLIKYIKYITSEVKLISSENMGRMLQVRGNDELAELCININSMSIELKNKFEQEREVEAAKNELITNVSHDLRTPLTAIIGYLDILRNEKLKDMRAEKEYLNSTYRLSLKLKTLIDELFEYTKLSNNNIVLDLVETDISSILIQMIGEYTPMFEKKGLRIVTDVPNRELITIIDVEKMVRVFDNILSNAEKYSFKPSDIVVKIKSEFDNIVISITNEGENIERDKLNKMFEKFYRGDISRSSKIEGSGLGLAISKKIIELHNGYIWIECNENLITINIKLPINNKI